MTTAQEAKQTVRAAERQSRPWTVWLARLGHAAKGIVYIVIGYLAFRAAFGASGQTTNSQGALQKIAEQPFGKLLLFIVGIGFIGYALWRFVQAGLDTENKGSEVKGIFQRIAYMLSGLAYGGLALTAFKIVLNVKDKSGNSQQDWTARLLSQPFGQWLVGIVGLIVIGMGLNAFYKAFTAKFCEHLNTAEMSKTENSWATFVGRAGYTARGVVLSIIGWFFIQAARHANPKESRGLDQALDTLASQPNGRLLLGIVAVGLIAYGIYALAEARYRRMYG
jgi:hypothetical protein